MKSIFRVQALPARQGDCLWIEYGESKHPHRLLIDGGTPETVDTLQSRILAFPVNQRNFELLVITHIDNDHIGGLLKLLDAGIPGLKFEDVWFNGWRHLPGSGFEEFGPVQGEKLSIWLDQPGQPWNQRFDRKSIAVPAGGLLPVKTLSGGLKLTVLSPSIDDLRRLRPVWEEECHKAGMDPSKPQPPPQPVVPGFEAFGVVDIDDLSATPFKEDTSLANGSSIALLAEFEGHRILLGGDAHATTLLSSVARLAASEGVDQLKIDVLKLPHHGSKANLSRDLLERVESPRYLFSTNGAQFNHPDQEAVARTICFGGQGAQLIFNYRTKFTMLWNETTWKSQYGYQTRYPAAGKEGINLNLI